MDSATQATMTGVYYSKDGFSQLVCHTTGITADTSVTKCHCHLLSKNTQQGIYHGAQELGCPGHDYHTWKVESVSINNKNPQHTAHLMLWVSQALQSST